jgi:hypothetical protein
MARNDETTYPRQSSVIAIFASFIATFSGLLRHLHGSQ